MYYAPKIQLKGDFTYYMGEPTLGFLKSILLFIYLILPYKIIRSLIVFSTKIHYEWLKAKVTFPNAFDSK